jgi:hypothetical protein
MNGSGERNSITFTDAGTLLIGGNITGGAIVGSQATTVFTNTGSYSVPNYTYHHLILNGTASLAANVSITGNLRVEENASLALDQYNFTINVNANASATIAGNLLIDGDGRLLESQGGTKTLYLDATGTIEITDLGGSTLPAFNAYDFHELSTVIYGATDAQTIENGSDYGNLVTAGGGTKTFESGGDIVIKGSLTIGSGTTLASNDVTVYVAGDWNNNSGFTQGTGSVVLNGSTTQTLQGASQTTFYNLSVQNSG